VECTLARIWSELLQVQRVGRNDNFFELGGHSLLAVSLIERLRREQLALDVRALFATPTLAALAQALGGEAAQAEVPPNAIPQGCERITPDMLPLVQLSQEEIDRVVATVPGGAPNVQDIYPLAPLQEGILFHHLVDPAADPYVLHALYAVDAEPRLRRLIEALQSVVDRHDVLRTAVLWEALREPVQVVCRRVALPVEELAFDPAPGDVSMQLMQRVDPRQRRIDVRRAPLLHVCVSHDAAQGRWLMLLLFHHLAIDHATLALVQQEVQAHLAGQQHELPAPVPFRDFVAHARLDVPSAAHEDFFRRMLSDVDEPTLPFGAADVRGDGAGTQEAQVEIDAGVGRRLRRAARRLGVGAASLCHLAWAQVLARLSGRDDVVFGTVLLGRMSSGRDAQRALGLFVNTLPLRLRIDGRGVQQAARETHELLARLLHHEHASLALAQRCSGVAPPAPLFSTLFNYRHDMPQPPHEAAQAGEGVVHLASEERSNYPLTMSVGDDGNCFVLASRARSPIAPDRVCGLMHTALQRLVDALEDAPQTALAEVDVMPAGEVRRLLHEWNRPEMAYPRERCVHELVQQQAARTPQATALVQDARVMSYGELNARANRLARHLRTLGVKPDTRVAVCAERGIELVVALLAILKAGGAYVPLDPSHPEPRLVHMLRDSAPAALLVHGDAPLAALATLDGALAHPVPTLDLVADAGRWAAYSDADLPLDGLSPQHLAYVIYTSGSTGQPKGVLIEHRSVVRLVTALDYITLGPTSVVAQASNTSFDAATFEVWGALAHGGRLVHVATADLLDPARLGAQIRRDRITVLFVTTALFNRIAQSLPDCFQPLDTLLFGGEAVSRPAVESIRAHGSPKRLLHVYGPTETTTFCAWFEVDAESLSRSATVPIGRGLAGSALHVLDAHGRLAGPGTLGELHVAGDGLARGYLNQPALTAEKFIDAPAPELAGRRLYRTG
ncbi:hypothetical protein BURC_01214, partial [Burkholderiaceae bacterium]